jgi:hypothetical protein
MVQRLEELGRRWSNPDSIVRLRTAGAARLDDLRRNVRCWRPARAMIA